MKFREIIILLLALAPALYAAEFHVATKGNDSNSGSKQAPFGTIQHAADLAQPGDINYITVCGFTLRQAATPWAGAMSEQVGLIGTHWSKGWIIENNPHFPALRSGPGLYTHLLSDCIRTGWQGPFSERSARMVGEWNAVAA